VSPRATTAPFLPLTSGATRRGWGLPAPPAPGLGHPARLKNEHPFSEIQIAPFGTQVLLDWVCCLADFRGCARLESHRIGKRCDLRRNTNSQGMEIRAFISPPILVKFFEFDDGEGIERI
jgi:hypothetical protein